MKSLISASVLGRLICAALLFYALLDHPYGYFTLMRWITLLVCGYCLFVAISQNHNQWIWTFSIIGLLFNPIIPVRMDRSTWAIVDILAGILFVVSIFFIREKTSKEQNDNPNKENSHYE